MPFLVFLLAGAAAPGAAPPRLQIEHPSPVTCLTWSPTGARLATGSQDGSVRITDAVTGKVLHRFTTGSAVSALAVAPDGKSLVLHLAGRTYSTWDLETGQRQEQGQFKNCDVDQLAFTADGQTVVGAGVGEFLQWNLSGRFFTTRAHQTVAGSSAALSADGRISAWAEPSGLIRLREYEPHIRTSPLHVGTARCIALAGPLLAVGGSDGIHLWDWALPQETAALTGLLPPTGRLAFAADSRTLAALADDGKWITIWDTARPRVRRRLPLRTPVTALVLSADGQRLATLGSDGKVVVWDAAARALQARETRREFTAAEMARLWADLAAADVDTVDVAWNQLGAAGDQVSGFLRQQVRQIDAPAVDISQIQKLVTELDAPTFAVRDRATQALKTLGDPAIAPLERLLTTRLPLDAERRVKAVLKSLGEPGLTPERRQVLETIDLLEQLHTALAIDLLKEIERDARIGPLRKEAGQALQRLSLLQK